MRSNALLYEIDTWLWLDELSRKCAREVHLGDVPAEEWDSIGAWPFDAVWLMGVWERSPVGIQIARELPDLQPEYRKTLSDFNVSDVAGSPYCVHRYVVEQRFGGTEGLRTARAELAKRGKGLILDLVPNHMAPDHPWTIEHPEYFMHEDDGSIAHGRDPYFPPWTDTAQLNIFNPGARSALIGTLNDIAAQCDGVRCDMAMLLLNDIVRQTWGDRAGAMPEREFWAEAVAAVKAAYPDFVLIAEVYWGLEARMQELGFDYCYDKELYDHLRNGNADDVRRRIGADIGYQRKLVRFLENHDEPRAAAVFSAGRERAAAVAISTLPGARMFHEGQFEGRRIKMPVQLGRRPEEPADQALHDFYWMLIGACHDDLFSAGQWRLAETTGWPDNQSHRNILAWTWFFEAQRVIVAINYSEGSAQARIRLNWEDLAGKTCRLHDVLRSETYLRSGDEMISEGLYVDLPPWAFHLLRFLGDA